MVVLVKDTQSRQRPFRMDEDSAERLQKSSNGRYKILTTEVEPVQKKRVEDVAEVSPISEKAVNKMSADEIGKDYPLRTIPDDLPDNSMNKPALDEMLKSQLIKEAERKELPKEQWKDLKKADLLEYIKNNQ